MKPDWKDAPEWAQFIAMDFDGTWYWYEDEPEPSRFRSDWSNRLRIERVTFAGWQETKEPRP